MTFVMLNTRAKMTIGMNLEVAEPLIQVHGQDSREAQFQKGDDE